MALALLLGALMTAVAGCSYTYEETNAAASASVTPEKTDNLMTVQELLAPKGAIFGLVPSRPLPDSGPCSYAEAVISDSDVDHSFPTKMFGGVAEGLVKVHAQKGIALVYRTYAFENLRWETPEARHTNAQVIEITEASFESLSQHDEGLQDLFGHIEAIGLNISEPYYIVDKACFSGSTESAPHSF